MSSKYPWFLYRQCNTLKECLNGLENLAVLNHTQSAGYTEEKVERQRRMDWNGISCNKGSFQNTSVPPKHSPKVSHPKHRPKSHIQNRPKSHIQNRPKSLIQNRPKSHIQNTDQSLTSKTDQSSTSKTRTKVSHPKQTKVPHPKHRPKSHIQNTDQSLTSKTQTKVSHPKHRPKLVSHPKHTWCWVVFMNTRMNLTENKWSELSSVHCLTLSTCRLSWTSPQFI